MSLLRRVVLGESRALTANQAIRELIRGAQTGSGLVVTERNALSLPIVWACVSILSQTFAQVPLKVYRRDQNGGRTEDREHRLFRILHDQPNPEMTSFIWREVVMSHLATWGNSYSEIQRNFFGEVIGIWPLLPDRTSSERTRSGELVYRTRVEDGRTSEEKVLPARDVLHIPGMGFDGLKGYSPIKMMMAGVGLAMAYQEFAERFFGNGAQPGFMLATDKAMTKEAVEDFEKRWNEAHQGLSNAQRVSILTNGMKPEKLGIPPEEAQFIESRQFQRSEIANIYRIPWHMVDPEKPSTWGSGIEQMSVGFVTFTMVPWFRRAEQAINSKLLSANAQGPLFAEFEVDGLLRGDFKSRMAGYAVGRQWGWYNANEIRGKENEPPIGPQGDIYLVPANMEDAKSFGATLPPGTPTKDEEPVTVTVRETDGSAMSHRHALADVTERILRREQADVSRGIEKLLRHGAHAEIPAWVEGFYADHRAWAERQALPVFAGITETLRAERTVEGDALLRAAQASAADYVLRLGSDSLADLRRAIQGEPDDLRRIFSDWERRPERIAQEEIGHAVRSIEAVIGPAPVRAVGGGRKVRKEKAALAALITDFLTRDEEPRQLPPPPQVHIAPQVINITMPEPPPVALPPVEVHVAPNIALEATLHQPDTEFVKDRAGNIVGVRSKEPD